MEHEFTALIKYNNHSIYFNDTSLTYDESKTDIFLDSDDKNTVAYKSLMLTHAKLFNDYSCMMLLKLIGCEDNKRYTFKISIEECQNE